MTRFLAAAFVAAFALLFAPVACGPVHSQPIATEQHGRYVVFDGMDTSDQGVFVERVASAAAPQRRVVPFVQFGSSGNPPCPDAVPNHAYVASNGDDSVGNGSIVCPFATVTHAQSVVAAAPTSQASYETARVIEVLGPGAFSSAISLPTLGAVHFVLGPGTSIGPITMTLDSTQQFSSFVQPSVIVEGGSIADQTIVGDGSSSISMVTSANPTSTTGCRIVLRNIKTNGKVSLDSSSSGPLHVYDFDGFATASSTSTKAFDGNFVDGSGNPIGGIALHGHDTRIVRPVNVWALDELASTWYGGDVTVGVCGAGSSIAQFGQRDSRFSGTHSWTGCLWLDGNSSYAIQNAAGVGSGWNTSGATSKALVMDTTAP